MINKRVQKFSFFLMMILLFACHNDSKVTLKPLASSAVILALGDSLTSGSGVKRKHSFPSQLSLLLNRKVINAGVRGNTTAQGLARLPKLLEKYQPQLVIVGLGGNDLLRRKSHQQIKHNLSNIIKLIKKNKIDLILIAPPKPSLILKAPPLYKELANEYNIIVDTQLLANLLGDKTKKSDRIHLNVVGYKELADGIYQILKDNQGI